mmetsp:Transcript_613/g.2616  ORF Transcript_613/g.2616 Transcript_613/m.2616 type:complete len:355 (-) Transcript_613:1093-2157(-)
MRQVLELPGDLEHDVVPLRENVTQLPDGLAHGTGLLALHDAVGGTVGIVDIVVWVQRCLRLHHADREVLVKHLVAELVVADLAVLAGVEVPEQLHHGLLREAREAELLEGLAELADRDHTVVVHVKSSEDVADQRELLAHGLPELLEHGLQVEGLKLRHGVVEELPGVLIHVEHLELVVVHLYHVARQEVLCLEQLARDLIHVHGLLQEAPSDNAQVPLWWLVDGQTVVLQEKTDHEDAVRILGLRVGEPGLEAQNLVGVREEFHEVLLGWLGDQVRHRGHGVVPRAVARVRWRWCARHRALRQLHLDAGLELGAQLFLEVLARELVRVVDEELVIRKHSHLLADEEVSTVHEI